MLRSLPINNHTKFRTNNLIKVDPGLALLCRGFCFGAIGACGKIGRGKYKAQGGLQELREEEKETFAEESEPGKLFFTESAMACSLFLVQQSCHDSCRKLFECI